MMGTGDSKVQVVQNVENTNLCCINYRKDRKNKDKSNTISKGRIESVAIPGSILRPWQEQTNGIKDALHDKYVSLQESFGHSSFKLSSVISLPTFNTNLENGEKTSELPQGWTSAQLTTLNNAIRLSASTMRIKSPGFFVLQVPQHSRPTRALPF